MLTNVPITWISHNIESSVLIESFHQISNVVFCHLLTSNRSWIVSLLWLVRIPDKAPVFTVVTRALGNFLPKL